MRVAAVMPPMLEDSTVSLIPRKPYSPAQEVAYPPATMCDHDFANDEPCLRLTMGSPWRDSGLTSPVSRDCVSGASPCDVVVSRPMGIDGIFDIAGNTEAIAVSRGSLGLRRAALECAGWLGWSRGCRGSAKEPGLGGIDGGESILMPVWRASPCGYQECVAVQSWAIQAGMKA